MHEREEELDTIITLLAAYVLNASKGNEELIRSTGFEVRAAPSPVGELGRPLNLRATTGAISGEIQLDSKSVRGAQSYVWEHSTDGSTGWQYHSTTTSARTTIKELPPVSSHWFRVAGVGASGQGPFSDPVKGIAG